MIRNGVIASVRKGTSTLALRAIASSPVAHDIALRLNAVRLQSTVAATAPKYSRVAPQLRQRRPVVNGEPIAFHISDLIKQNSVSYSPQLREKQYDSDLVVVLDMDECLIHSQFLSNPTSAKVFAHQLAQQRRHNSHSAQAQQRVDHFRITLPDGDLVHVNIRPDLEEFLEFVTGRFETHVFTAAMEVYAKPVLDRLDPDNTRFAGRWYRESCTFQNGAYVKCLEKLPLNKELNRVVLVDNNPLSFLANPANGILVSSFYSDPTDKSLRAVMQLLEELDTVNDVRPFLEERFALKEALQDIRRAA